jgi:predicted Zn-dependent protease
VIKLYEGDRAINDADIAETRDELNRLVEAHPEDPATASVLGLIDAALGKKEAAIQQARLAVERLPISRDAVDGPAFVVNLATVYAWTNESDLALQKLAESAKTPFVAREPFVNGGNQVAPPIKRRN